MMSAPYTFTPTQTRLLLEKARLVEAALRWDSAMETHQTGMELGLNPPLLNLLDRIKTVKELIAKVEKEML